MAVERNCFFIFSLGLRGILFAVFIENRMLRILFNKFYITITIINIKYQLSKLFKGYLIFELLYFLKISLLGLQELFNTKSGDKFCVREVISRK